MKRIVTLLLSWTVALAVSGQVAIIPLPHQAGYFSLDDIWRVSLINQAKPSTVRLELMVEDEQRQLILTANSPVFNLLQGSNPSPFNTSSFKVQYGSGNIPNVVRNTGRFPYGNYTICYRVLSANSETLLGEFCQEETVLPFSPPELITPFNDESVTTTYPVLVWKAPFPPGDIPVEYSLKLVELKSRQDALEALEKNAPLLSRNRLFSTNLIYPADAPKLEIDKSYAWQVSAKAGDFELGVTEVWTFKVAPTVVAMMVPQGAFKAYREFKLAPDGSFNPIKQKLRFSFNNRCGAPLLDYEVTSPPTTNLDRAYFRIYPQGKQNSPLSMTNSIALLTGTNRLTINLSSVAGITNGENYIMVMRDPYGKEYFLEFTYYN
jgi:hypothetical protein